MSIIDFIQNGSGSLVNASDKMKLLEEKFDKLSYDMGLVVNEIVQNRQILQHLAEIQYAIAKDHTNLICEIKDKKKQILVLSKKKENDILN